MIASVMAGITLFFATTVSVMAAEVIHYDGSGTIFYEPDRTKLLTEQTQILQDCGFNAQFNEDGSLITLAQDSPWGAFGTEQIQQLHDNLINNGILSFVVYENSVCSLKIGDTARNLVVCLDFSNYNVTTFESGFLEGVIYALMGTSLEFPYLGGNNGMVESTETTVDRPAAVDYINAADGSFITDKQIELHLRGMSDNEAWTTYINIIDENGVKGANEYVHEYSLHIKLPSNTWTADKQVITFNSGSLTVTGIRNFSVATPSCIGYDIGNIILEEGKDFVSIAADATGDNNHVHYIGATLWQIQYLLDKSFDTVLPSTKTTYVEEIFYKPYANSDFIRAYAGVGRENGNLYANIYDQPSYSTLNTSNMQGILIFFYWLCHVYEYPTGYTYDSLSYVHYERDENNLVNGVTGELTCDWASAGDTGRSTVHCSHGTGINADAPTLVGYFDKGGGFYNANGEGMSG